MIIVLLLMTLIPVKRTANIFSGAYFGGSHLTAVYEIAMTLAEAGHNITFVSAVPEELEKQRKHPNMHSLYVASQEEVDPQLWARCEEGTMKAKTGEIPAHFDDCIKMWGDVWKRSADVFSGEEVRSFFSGTKFDIILSENAKINGMALLGTLMNVPVINFQPTFFIHLSQMHSNLPMLASSQPSMIFTEAFDQSPPLMHRLSRLSIVRKHLPFIKSGPHAMQPFLEKHGFSSLDDVENSIKLYLTNDHPAFTFPFLRPPNDIAVGCANLLGSKQNNIEFSPHIQHFLNKSYDRDLIYVSFGSYLKMQHNVSWFMDLISILVKLNLRIILKIDKQSYKNIPESVLPLSWAPQKDLLRSGQIKLFISHCGNNGRLETIYYNVPVLCIPQFGDQQINSEIIKYNGFGEILLKEDVLDKAETLVREMLANHNNYQRKMKMASNVVESEPGNVKEKLVFYVEYVAKHKNADYLMNKVIQQQSLVQIYNLDIILPVCLILFSIFALVFYVLLKCVHFLNEWSKVVSKKEY